MERFSLDKKGDAYEILVNEGETVIGRAVVKLTPPKVESPELRVNGQSRHILKPK